MSRAKAVEAAMREIWDGAPLKGPTPKGCRAVLERLADEMRIEGMREAARVKPDLSEVTNPRDGFWFAGGAIRMVMAIRARIRELEKKRPRSVGKFYADAESDPNLKDPMEYIQNAIKEALGEGEQIVKNSPEGQPYPPAALYARIQDLEVVINQASALLHRNHVVEAVDLLDAHKTTNER